MTKIPNLSKNPEPTSATSPTGMRRWAAPGVGLAVVLLAACGGEAGAPANNAAGTPSGPPATVSAELTAKLAAADKKDGTEDKVVHKCAGCALGMDGKAEHTLAVGGYTMHFCGRDCLGRYQRDAVGELTRLKVE